MISHVTNAEDYRDYQADKGLHEAYKLRDAMKGSHSLDALARKVMEHEAEAAVIQSPSDAPKP